MQETTHVIDLWKSWSSFFKSDPMYVILSVTSLISFIITIVVYLKIRNVNKKLKQGKRINFFLNEYEIILKILTSKQCNIPSDLYARVKKINDMLFCHINFIEQIKIKKMFSTVTKEDNKQLAIFINDVKIQFEKDII